METPSTPPRLHALTALLLAAAAFMLFAPAISYDFLNYDDDLYVYANPAVRAGLSGEGFAYALTTGNVGTWAPLTWLSYQTDATIFGLRPAGFHATNILLHIAAGVALFFALLALLEKFWPSVLTAGIFLLHPLRTESVAWIAERKDVLFALWWALGLLAYAKYARRPNLARWALVFLCFLAGLMSKFMMATFPFVLLLLDFWPLRRLSTPFIRTRLWPLVREKIPFFLAALAAHQLTVHALSTTETLRTTIPDWPTRLARVAENYGFYFAKTLWPASRSVLYPLTPIAPLAAGASLLLLLSLTSAAIWRARREPWWLVGWLWFLGTLVPVIGFVEFGHFHVADRYAYIPAIGLTLVPAFGLTRWAEKFSRPDRTLATATAIILATCAAGTFLDLPRWKNSLALYDAALRVGPHRTAYNNRGTEWLRLGQPARALEDFNAALRLLPDYPSALNNRANAQTELGNLDAAIADASAAIHAQPNFADAFNNRAIALARRGEPAAALADYDHAIALNPTRALYYHNRAAALLDLQQPTRAQADLDLCRRHGGSPHPGLVAAVAAALKKQP